MDVEQAFKAALDDGQADARAAAARFVSDAFYRVGTVLHVTGSIIGPDRRNGLSPGDYGEDATVAISMLMRIAGQLVSGVATLIATERTYAGSALVRQMLEVEYLSWTFERRHEDAAKWMRVTRSERKNAFAPFELRRASGGHFSDTDYRFHCEMGGHPVPGAWTLLRQDPLFSQWMLSQAIIRGWRIWDHCVGWGQGKPSGQSILQECPGMAEQRTIWERADSLSAIPVPAIQS